MGKKRVHAVAALWAALLIPVISGSTTVALVPAAELAAPVTPARASVAVADVPATAEPVRRSAPDAADDCVPLEMGTFGELTDSQRVTGELPGNATTCFAVTAEAGPHWVRLNLQSASQYRWILRDAAGRSVCESAPSVMQVCNVPAAGTHTLHLTNRVPGNPVWPYEAAVIPLSGTEGCADPIGTAWTEPPAVVDPTSAVQVFCQPTDAQPGRTVTALSNAPFFTLINATGSWLCERVCVLPENGGPFRLLAFSHRGRLTTQPLTMEIRGVSDPVGCPTVATVGFGVAPSHPESPVNCRTFTVDQPGSYLVRGRTNHQVHDPDGRLICRVVQYESCNLPRAGTYTMFHLFTQTTPWAGTVVRLDGPGCVPVGDRGAAEGGAHRSSIDVPGEVECLQLPTESDTDIVLDNRLHDQDPDTPVSLEIPVYDADGNVACSWQHICQPRGKAPFRAVPAIGPGTATYTSLIQRVTGDTGCTELPMRGAGPTVTVSADRYAGCLTFDMDRPGQRRMSWTTESGAGSVGLNVVYGPGGTPLCTWNEPSATVCEIQYTGRYVLLLTSDGQQGTHRVQLSVPAVACPQPTRTRLPGGQPGARPAGDPDSATPCVRPGRLR